LSLRSNLGLKLANAFSVKKEAEISERLRRKKKGLKLANAFGVKGERKKASPSVTS